MIWVLLAIVIPQTLAQNSVTTISFNEQEHNEKKEIYTSAISLAEKGNTEIITPSTILANQETTQENYIHTTTYGFTEIKENEINTTLVNLANKETTLEPIRNNIKNAIEVTTTVEQETGHEKGTISLTLSLAEQERLRNEEIRNVEEIARLEQQAAELAEEQAAALAEKQAAAMAEKQSQGAEDLCIYKGRKNDPEKKLYFDATTAQQCQKLCQTLNPNPNPIELHPKCLGWSFVTGTSETSCYIYQTKVIVIDTAVFGITNCNKPGVPSGFAPTCSHNPGSGSLKNELLPRDLPNSEDCKSACDRNSSCLAWQYFGDSRYCRLSFWEVSKTQNDVQDVGFCFEGTKSTQISAGESWWCGAHWGTRCGPNCCGNNECCKGPDVCASPEDCPALQCLHKEGQVCGNNCCLGDSPFCCASSDGTNTCVDSIDSCRAQNCQKDIGLSCGDQCCTGNSSCCTGLTVNACVASLDDCIALECIEEGGQACGNSCCGGGTFCCNGKCLTDIDDCLAEQCLQVEGQLCGKSCCRDNSKTPICCKDTRTCVASKEECVIDNCPNWCTTAGDCCSNMFWVCCPQDSGIVCAANPLFCRRDLAEFAEGFIQKKIK